MNRKIDESIPDETPEYPLAAPIKPNDPERRHGDGEKEDNAAPDILDGNKKGPP